MKDSYEQRIQNQFGGVCVKVLKNEAGCIRREYVRRRDREKSLHDLTDSELEQTATVDKHFMARRCILQKLAKPRENNFVLTSFGFFHGFGLFLR